MAVSTLFLVGTSCGCVIQLPPDLLMVLPAYCPLCRLPCVAVGPV